MYFLFLYKLHLYLYTKFDHFMSQKIKVGGELTDHRADFLFLNGKSDIIFVNALEFLFGKR